MLKIVYGKFVEVKRGGIFSGFGLPSCHIWRESFSLEVSDKSEHEIIFGLNEKCEDDMGRILEIWKDGKKVFDHLDFDFDRLHGLEVPEDYSDYEFDHRFD